MRYTGRFAPSPTGPLHFGSLLAALASYLDARSNQGRWLLRIEDLDHYRINPAYSAIILNTLETYGFEWDGEAIYQSTRITAYEQALQQLQQRALAYPCFCTRKQLRATAPHGPYGLIYPGTCRPPLSQKPTNQRQPALRIRTNNQPYAFHDSLQGDFGQKLEQDLGDFIIKRSDGVVAYQLAVVVDDAWQGITHIVRGADLLDNTPRQLYLQALLHAPQPHYLHIPVACDASGHKLSKQSAAPDIRLGEPVPLLCQALQFLGQKPPPALEFDSVADCLQWSVQNWAVKKVPAVQMQLFHPVDTQS